MKANKLIVVLLSIIVLITFFTSCNANNGGDKTDSVTESNIGESSSVESEEPTSEPEKSENPEVTWELITGSFIQYYPFFDYTDIQLDRHFNYLVEAGIEYLVLGTSVFTDESHKYTAVYYPSESAKKNRAVGFDATHDDMCEKMLAQCEKHGIKAYIALNENSEGWYKMLSYSNEWFNAFANTGTTAAEEMYNLYKTKYPTAFYGWYFVPEIPNYFSVVTQNEHVRLAAFINKYLDKLTEIDSNMPFLMSPYFSEAEGMSSVEETVANWQGILTRINWRNGDIFAPQDSVGAGGTTIDSFSEYFKGLKTVIDEIPNLKLYSNPESFVQSNWSSAPMSRFIQQLSRVAPYVDGYISFAYSHYYAPDIVGTAQYHNDYLYYKNNGRLKKGFDNQALKIDSFVCKNDVFNLVLELKAENTEALISHVLLYDNEKLLGRVDCPPEKRSDKSIELDYKLLAPNDNRKHTYKAVLYDFLNATDTAQLEFTAESSIVKISDGCDYTIEYNGSANYPDIDKKLTDGKYASMAVYSDPLLCGYNDEVTITVDLKKVDTISGLCFRALSNGNAGSYKPYGFTVSFSSDGVEFGNSVTVNSDSFEEIGGYTSMSALFNTKPNARYVRLTVTELHGWFFTDEIEIYK